MMDTDLDQGTLRAVLEKLGLPERPERSAAGLRELFQRWCGGVPFDNLLKRIYLKNPADHPVPGDSARSFFASWLRYNTGGTCWAGSNALFALLDAVGFRPRWVVGKMGARPEQKEPNHGALIVEIEGRSFLLDPSVLLHQIVPLEPGESEGVAHPAQRWRVAEAARGAWLVHWWPLHFEHPIPCLITPDEASAGDVARHARAAVDFSLFNFSTYVRRNGPAEVLGACFERRVKIDRAGQKTVEQLDAREMKRYLVDELGYAEQIVDQLPAADPLPPPIAALLEPFLSRA